MTAGFIVGTLAWAGLITIASPSAAADQDCFTSLELGLVCTANKDGGAGGAVIQTTALPEVSDKTNDGVYQTTESAVSRTSRPGDSVGIIPGECAWRIVDPAPPAGDPRWEGNDPSTGVVLYNICNGPVDYTFAASVAAAPPPPPPPDPAVLAQQAFAQLALPEPTIGRSPGPDSSDPAHGGLPYTIVNLWTWYWTDPAGWVDQSVTVTLQGVSATATAKPTALVFDPGDGSAPVSCAGPGRPWSESDANAAPSGGGCGFRYAAVTPDGPLTSTVSIQWHATWTGTGNTGGDLGDVTTSATSSFLVEQIQVVTR